jgi:hypothetical protein
MTARELLGGEMVRRWIVPTTCRGSVAYFCPRRRPLQPADRGFATPAVTLSAWHEPLEKGAEMMSQVNHDFSLAGKLLSWPSTAH